MQHAASQNSKIDYGTFITSNLSSNKHDWRSMASAVLRQIM